MAVIIKPIIVVFKYMPGEEALPSVKVTVTWLVADNVVATGEIIATQTFSRLPSAMYTLSTTL